MDKDYRDCENCVWNKPGFGCAAWECEYINRAEAIAAYKERKESKDE